MVREQRVGLVDGEWRQTAFFGVPGTAADGGTCSYRNESTTDDFHSSYLSTANMESNGELPRLSTSP